MKLIRASIQNFRLLKDITLDFSIDSNKPLTVIRAANESGKTTCEYALMWGLWGEQALPAKKYNDFLIFPIDMIERDPEVTTKVEIDFIVPASNGKIPISYRLIRTCFFSQSNSNKINDTLDLYEIKSSGLVRLADSAAKKLIDSILPLSLKDIYFTDGDRAMTFIEQGTQDSIKRRRVKNAIRSLLSLDELEASVRHLKNVEMKFEGQIDNKNYAKIVTDLNQKIEFQEESMNDYNEELEELCNTRENVKHDLEKYNEQIEEIIKQGDKKRLIGERASLEKKIIRTEDSQTQVLMELRDLVHHEQTSLIFLLESFNKAKQFLKGLKDKQQLPKANIPILQELLENQTCFCGASLDKNTSIGLSNIEKIKKTINESADADRKTEIATSLHFQVVNIDTSNALTAWMQAYSQKMQSYYNFGNTKTEEEYQLYTLNQTIDSIKDGALEGLRLAHQKLSSEYTNIIANISRYTTRLNTAKEKISDLEEEKKKATKKVNANDTGIRKATVAQILKNGFSNILDRINNDELKKVSDEMNRIFLEMIGSAPDANDFSSITKAELSPEYEILVYGNKNQQINPDQDLNGASRRAITLAFILALTKVSEVEAPNVIDTPLGMMSGYVKQSVLNQMIKEGNQIVLFLTHDEINGVESIIDQYAGNIYTLTNPSHYPKMLKNKPNVPDARIIRCECTHRESCNVCERNNYQGA